MENPKAKPMANRAYEYLYKKIVSCEFLPGREINEKQLSEATGIGRTPLREALLAMHKEGLVEIFPRKGMRVAPMSEKHANDLYQARKLIEPAVIAGYKSLYSKETLIDFKERFIKSEQMSGMERFELDAAFHTYLVAITENEILTSMYHSLMARQIRLGMYAAIKMDTACAFDTAQHCDIIDALLRENESDSQDAVILHINYSLVRSVNAIRIP